MRIHDKARQLLKPDAQYNRPLRGEELFLLLDVLHTEEERYGPGVDGYAEHLEDVARAAEFECYGPAGLGEG